MAERRYAKPLNPALYAFLWHTFGGCVRVHKHGQRFRYAVKTVGGDTVVVKIPGGGGEEYSVCCPICGDKRYRCFINHSFGTEIHGVEITNVVHCFNESCEGLVKWFSDGMLAFCHGTQGAYVTEAAKEEAGDFDLDKIAEEAAKGHERLHGTRLLTALPLDHPACEYVTKRGFDIQELVESFQVGYYKGVRKGIRNKRLIAPVYYKQQAVGWNARVIDGHTPLTEEPSKKSKAWPYREGKYVNALGYPKSLFLYNRDLAAGYDVIGVVEGVTDVWAAGTWSVGIMGKSMSEAQIIALCDIAEARKAWVVMLGDGNTAKDDAAKHWKMNFELFRDRYKYPERVRLHLFEDGDDPGNHSRADLMDLVTRVLHDKRTDSC